MKLAIRVIVALILLVLSARPMPVAAASGSRTVPLDWDIPGGHFYTETNGFPVGTSPMGYAIVDDAEAHLWTAFREHGGVEVLGYPISHRFIWGGFVIQVTQKAVLQWRPEKHDVDFVNVFDELSKLGADAWLSSVRSIPPPLPPAFDHGLSWSQVVTHRLALLRDRPALLRRYRAAANPFDLYGLPTSPVVDAGPMYVVRLQRAVLQEWKVDQPWARAGQVTVANGGELAKEAGVFPWKELRPTAPPAGTWTPTPGAYVLSGNATWYGPGFVGKPMANGQIYEPEDATTTASNAFPIGSQLRVTSPKTGRTITVVVRDTGRFPYPDVLDLSPAAFQLLGASLATGVVPVTVALIAPGRDETTSRTHAPPSA